MNDFTKAYMKGYKDGLAKQSTKCVEQGEPVAWMSEENECIFFDADKPDPMAYDFWTPLYTHPQPKREPLTDEQAQKLLEKERCWLSNGTALRIARAIEAAHGITEE